MAWIILLFAGLLEVVWAVGLKYTHGFTRLTPSIITITAIIASMGLLAYAMRDLPAGTAYAIWTGVWAYSLMRCVTYLREPLMQFGQELALSVLQFSGLFSLVSLPICSGY